MRYTIIIIVAFLFSSCKHESNLEGLPAISFSQDVQPVYQTNCSISGCHDSQSAEGGKVFEDYETIIKYVKSGEPDKSKAYTALKDPFQPMPPKTPVSEEDRKRIRLWILQGAKNN